MPIHRKSITAVLISMGIGLCCWSCRKMINVPQPVNSLTTEQVFTSNSQAASAMAGVYTQMINGGSLSFSNGYCTLLGGLSADELLYTYIFTDAGLTGFSSNQLLYNNSYSGTVWSSAYKIIYKANAMIEGIAASESDALTDSVRNELTAQAKFVRAFSYFYLVNLFGDVPLVLTIDFNETRFMTKTPASKVYEQIIADLKEAQSLLTVDYPVTGSVKERILPNKWAATALLARVYLYTGDYTSAAAEAGIVISNVATFSLESDLNKVFLTTSKEAIWQLKQGITETGPLNSTREGYTLLPAPLRTGVSKYSITDQLLKAFETGDRRRTAWIDSSNNTYAGASLGLTRFPYKYKLGGHNAVSNAASSEYYMVLRLAEMYLVHAEAAAHGANGGTQAAITDLNVIRSRAGLPVLPASLSADEVINAIAQERRVELFAEWGHRWLDLKRTGKAHDVLSAISNKQPWAGDYQLLYPIPGTEIEVNPRLEQNEGY